MLGSLLIGTLLGEWMRIEDGLQNLGKALEQRFSKEGDDGSNKFVRVFLTSSLLFCVGPMTILGSIQNGLTGDYNLLAVKSVLDGFATLAFSSLLEIKKIRVGNMLPGLLIAPLIVWVLSRFQ